MKHFVFTGVISAALSAAALLSFTTAAGADYIRNGKIVDCYCTDKSGSRVDLGQTTCIQVDGRMYTAQCQMSLNVPMWRELSDGCLSSSLAPPFSGRSAPRSLGESLELPQSKPALNARPINPRI